MRDVAIVLAAVKSRVFLIRRRSRIDIKQDLDTEEICSDMVSEESNITPWLKLFGKISKNQVNEKVENDTKKICDFLV